MIEEIFDTEQIENLTINQIKSRLVKMDVEMDAKNHPKKYYIDLYNRAIQDPIKKSMLFEELREEEQSPVSSKKRSKKRQFTDEKDKITTRKRKRDDEKEAEEIRDVKPLLIKLERKEISRIITSETPLQENKASDQKEFRRLSIKSTPSDYKQEEKLFTSLKPSAGSEQIPFATQSEPITIRQRTTEQSKLNSQRNIPIYHNIQIINSYRPDSYSNTMPSWNSQFFNKELEKVKEAWERTAPEVSYNMLKECINNTKICTEHKLEVNTININTIWKIIFGLGFTTLAICSYNRYGNEENYNWIREGVASSFEWLKSADNFNSIVVGVLIIIGIAFIFYLLYILERIKRKNNKLIADNCIQQVEAHLVDKEQEGNPAMIDADLFIETFCQENKIKVQAFKDNILSIIDDTINKGECKLDYGKSYIEGVLKTFWKLK